jgi:hypothetical protein
MFTVVVTKTHLLIVASALLILILMLMIMARVLMQRNVRIYKLERHLRLSNYSMVAVQRFIVNRLPVGEQYMSYDLQADIDANNRLLRPSPPPECRCPAPKAAVASS